MECRAYEQAREILLEDITDVEPSVSVVLSFSKYSFFVNILTLWTCKQTFPLKYIDHLLYHYLGGTIMALLNENARAIEMLEIVSWTFDLFMDRVWPDGLFYSQCVSAPGSGVSSIQIDAYKKLVLLQLIANGKVCFLFLLTYPQSYLSTKAPHSTF